MYTYLKEYLLSSTGAILRVRVGTAVTVDVAGRLLRGLLKISEVAI